jgi:hypothetical protein
VLPLLLVANQTLRLVGIRLLVVGSAMPLLGCGLVLDQG